MTSSVLKFNDELEGLVRELYHPRAELLSRVDSIVSELIKLVEENKNPISESASSSSSSCFSQETAILIAYPDHIIAADSSSALSSSSTSAASSSSNKGQEAPLDTLARFCEKNLKHVISMIHVLPFHPHDDNYHYYSITDYDNVDPAFGSWNSFDRLRKRTGFSLMFDLVLNHCSAKFPLFQKACRKIEDPVEGEKEKEEQDILSARKMFAHQQTHNHHHQNNDHNNNNNNNTNNNMKPMQILRARDDTPLFHDHGSFKNVWCTYGKELIDFNWHFEPSVLVMFSRIVLESIAQHGFRGMRLDAFGYVIKDFNTSCVNHPKLKVLLRIFRLLIEAAGFHGQVAILPSITNVSASECFETCFTKKLAQSDISQQLSYHLPLPALLLLSLHRGNFRALASWLQESLPSLLSSSSSSEGEKEEELNQKTLLNLSSTHDGIGLTWTQGIIDDQERSFLIDRLISLGGIFKTRRKTDLEKEPTPWEICITTFSACATTTRIGGGGGGGRKEHLARFLAIQFIVASLKGVPAFYLSLFVGGENATEDVESIKKKFESEEERSLKCCERAINRSKFRENQAEVIPELVHMLKIRRANLAFHPHLSSQTVRCFGENSSVMCILRNYYHEKSKKKKEEKEQQEEEETICCVVNIASTPVFVNSVDALTQITLSGGKSILSHLCQDILSGELFDLRFGILLAPYRYLWLKHVKNSDELLKGHESLERNVTSALQQTKEGRREIEMTLKWRCQSIEQCLHNNHQEEEGEKEQQQKKEKEEEIFFEINDFDSSASSSSSSSSSSSPSASSASSSGTRIIFAHHSHPLHKSVAESISRQTGGRAVCRCFKSMHASSPETLRSWERTQNFLNNNNNNNENENTSAFQRNPCPNTFLSGIDAEIDRLDPKHVENFLSQLNCFDNLNNNNIDVIVTSPFQRSLQSASLIASKLSFSSSAGKSIKIIGLEDLKAHVNSHSHSRRLPLETLKVMFPHVEFIENKNNNNNQEQEQEEEVFSSFLKYESRESIEERIRSTFSYLVKKYQGKTVLCVSHFSFLLSCVLPGDDTKLCERRRSSSLYSMLPIFDTTNCKLLNSAISSPKVIGGSLIDTIVQMKKRKISLAVSHKKEGDDGGEEKDDEAPKQQQQQQRSNSLWKALQETHLALPNVIALRISNGSPQQQQEEEDYSFSSLFALATSISSSLLRKNSTFCFQKVKFVDSANLLHPRFLVACMLAAAQCNIAEIEFPEQMEEEEEEEEQDETVFVVDEFLEQLLEKEEKKPTHEEYLASASSLSSSAEYYERLFIKLTQTRRNHKMEEEGENDDDDDEYSTASLHPCYSANKKLVGKNIWMNCSFKNTQEMLCSFETLVQTILLGGIIHIVA